MIRRLHHQPKVEEDTSSWRIHGVLTEDRNTSEGDMDGQRSKGGGGVSGFMLLASSSMGWLTVRTFMRRRDMSGIVARCRGYPWKPMLLPHGLRHGHHGMPSPGSGDAEAGKSAGGYSPALSYMNEASSPRQRPADAGAGPDLASAASGKTGRTFVLGCRAGVGYIAGLGEARED